MKVYYSIAIAAAALALSGCTVGPNYQRPQVAVPTNFRAPQATEAPLPESQDASLADLKWFEVFHDAQLQALIKTALEQNYDLRDAVARVDEARASLGITRSNQYPQVSASGDLQFTRLSRDGQFPLPASFVSSQNRNWGEAALNLLSFQVDLWGQLRRATEGARANLLNADWNRKTVITTVVSQMAADYFQLLELDSELEISRSTLETRRESLQLTNERQGHGIATQLDVRQAEELVDSTAASIPQLQQQIEQTEDQMSLLLGKNPGNIERARTFSLDYVPPEVPTGLPSTLLERRPDIRAAEQGMIAANANIGVAKAAYFPQISLTGSIGGQSSSLANLFAGPAGAWSFVPQLTQSIFTAGRLKNNVRLAAAQREDAQIAWEKSISTAFQEVSDALIAHQRTRESRVEQQKLVTALQDRKRLAYARYQGGVDTQLNALDADRDLLSAELTLEQVRYAELVSVVQLYKALGGGWQ
ncbi:MAG TPA: efflux transporter outer membrane subunit [Bryobacteraceae bacterium]|nr:efflux transporter outer membrane subunit [Bryobacteraceae bacterium]